MKDYTEALSFIEQHKENTDEFYNRLINNACVNCDPLNGSGELVKELNEKKTVAQHNITAVKAIFEKMAEQKDN